MRLAKIAHRIKELPVKSKLLKTIGLLVIVGIAFLAYRKWSGDKTAPSENNPAALKRIPVVAKKLSRYKFEDAVTIQGNIKARNFALVSPKVQGTLDAVYVREGDTVTAGKTLLFQTDNVQLQKAVDIARQNLNVANCALAEKKANAERVDADFKKVALDYERYQRLHDEKVVTSDAFEQRQSAYEQIVAMKKHAATLINLAGEEVKKADIALQIAEKDYRDSKIFAPMNGRVSQRLIEPGEMGMPGKPGIRIDDVNELEISVFLPGQYYARAEVGKTMVRLSEKGVELGIYPVTYKSPTIDQSFRTFEVKCALRGNGSNLVPGALADAHIVFAQSENLGVPADAVMYRNGQSIVFTVADGLAKIIPVKTGLETNGSIAIMSDVLQPGMMVVVMGQFLINNGSAVELRKGGE